jgi:hypothetical protein
MLAEIGTKAASARGGRYRESLMAESSGRLIGLVIDRNMSLSGIIVTAAPLLLCIFFEER